MIGCSEQIPNLLRAYHLIGTASDGSVLLSRRGVPHSAHPGEVGPYAELMEALLGVVLRSIPASYQALGRDALIRRWNRDWGVEPEDFDSHTDLPSVGGLSGTS